MLLILSVMFAEPWHNGKDEFFNFYSWSHDKIDDVQ